MEAHQLLIARQGQSRTMACLRRGLDIVLAATVLLLLSPVVAVVAFAIAVSSPGPVVFRQRRLGRDLNPFTVLKFRTMHANADSAPHRDYVRTLIDSQDDEDAGQGRALQARRRRPRHRASAACCASRAWTSCPSCGTSSAATWRSSGRAPSSPTRRSSTRPPTSRRFAVKPGLTGLWQVSGRNERTYEEMVRLDVEYAERNSIGLDLLILAKTVWVVLTRKGAA